VNIPVDRVQGIFARENGQGAFFTVESPAALAAAPSTVAAPADADSEPPKPPAAGRTRLKIVK
jgi:stringent starvation protein B